MKIANLYDCFERHLLTLDIAHESEECFVATVVEKFLINMGGHGFHFNTHAEDTFRELCDEVHTMLRKKTYGYVSVNEYREDLRNKAAA